MLANSQDVVYFARGQCSRQHAFEAFIHAGIAEPEASAKAAALPKATGPAAVLFAQADDQSSRFSPEEYDAAAELVVREGKSPKQIVEEVYDLLDRRSAAKDEREESDD